MPKIALYARKSVSRDTSISTILQISHMKTFFESKYTDCEFFEFSDDGATGKNTNRTDFERMNIQVKYNSFDIIGVYATDRIARNHFDFVKLYEEYRRHDTLLVSTSEGYDCTTEQGEFIMHVLSLISDNVGKSISNRVKLSMYELSKIGSFSGGTPPLGYTKVRLPYNDKKLCYLELVPNLKPKVKEIFTLATQGVTCYTIGNKLNISPKTIYNIIINPVYLESSKESADYLKSLGFKIYGNLNGKGFLPYNRHRRSKGKDNCDSSEKLVSVSVHEAIVSSDMWITANKNVKNRGSEKKPRISNKSALAHLPKCSCGSGMFIHQTGSKNSKNRNTYFRCSNQKQHKNCASSWLRADNLETSILKQLKELQLDKSTLEKFCDYKNNSGINYSSLIKEKNKKLAKIESDIQNLATNLKSVIGYAANIIADNINELSEAKENLKNELTELEEKKLADVNTLTVDILQNHIQYILSNFDKLNMQDKKIFINEIISTIQYDGNNYAKVILY